MELRVLEYFLAVAREESISGATKALHLSQPTLSRQLKDLEYELGKPLMIRGTRKITLTEEGILLRKRATEILALADRTVEDIKISSDSIAGDVYICTGESECFRLIAKVAKSVNATYPDIHFHISSGDNLDVLEQLDHGTIDFGLVFSDYDHHKYNGIEIPSSQTWGVLMHPSSPLAAKESLTLKDLWDQPLITSRSHQQLGIPVEHTNIVATYSLLYNASLLVEEGLGYAICFNQIVNTTGNDHLIFVPFKDSDVAPAYIVWKKYQVFSKAANCFLNELL